MKKTEITASQRQSSQSPEPLPKIEVSDAPQQSLEYLAAQSSDSEAAEEEKEKKPDRPQSWDVHLSQSPDKLMARRSSGRFKNLELWPQNKRMQGPKDSPLAPPSSPVPPPSNVTRSNLKSQSAPAFFHCEEQREQDSNFKI